MISNLFWKYSCLPSFSIIEMKKQVNQRLSAPVHWTMSCSQKSLMPPAPVQFQLLRLSHQSCLLDDKNDNEVKLRLCALISWSLLYDCEKPQLEDLVKAVWRAITSNGVPYLQMSSIRLHIISWRREGVRKGTPMGSLNWLRDQWVWLVLPWWKRDENGKLRSLHNEKLYIVCTIHLI